jgi:hypothetical protein
MDVVFWILLGVLLAMTAIAFFSLAWFVQGARVDRHRWYESLYNPSRVGSRPRQPTTYVDKRQVHIHYYCPPAHAYGEKADGVGPQITRRQLEDSGEMIDL